MSDSKATTLIPLNGYVVIKPTQSEEMTESGLYIPDTANKEKPQQGEVVAVSQTNVSSNGTKLPIEVKIGDKVLFGRYSGEDVKLGRTEYKIVEITSIRAIVKE